MPLDQDPSRKRAPIRFVIGSGRELARESFVALLESKGLRLIARASNVRQLVHACRRHAPGLAFVETRLPGSTDGSPVRALLQSCPDERVVALCGDSGQPCLAAEREGTGDLPLLPCCAPQDCPAAVRENGAKAILRLSDAVRDLQRILRALSRDDAPADLFPAGVRQCRARRNLDRYVDRLSPREIDVAACVGQGLSNREIASTLHVTVSTVKKHVGRVLAKLELEDRLQLGLFVLRHAHRFPAPSPVPPGSSRSRRGPKPAARVRAGSS